MKIIRQFALPAALALGISSSLSAQPGGRGPDGPPPPPDPIARALDANNDHVIDAGEIAGASDALLALDTNNDGSLTRDEIRPPRPPKDGADADGPPPEPPAGKARDHRPPPPDKDRKGGKGKNAGHRPPPPVIAALDTDRDGTISAAEIAAAPASLAKLDRNKDGKLDGSELRPGRQGRPGGPGGPGGQGGQGGQGPGGPSGPGQGGGRPPRGNR